MPYHEGTVPPSPAAYGALVAESFAGLDVKLILEPGRLIVGNAGIMVTKVIYVKQSARTYVIVDAAMNDLIRPALYDAWHTIERVTGADATPIKQWQVVGPVCESGDFLGHDRELALEPGALLAVHSAGAYGMAQSSNYNTRPRAAEVLVEGDSYRVIRRRETIRDLLAAELPEA